MRESEESLAFAREFLSYDPESGVITRTKPRAKAKAGEEAGSQRADGYRFLFLMGKYKVYSHRLAWAMYYGVWPSTQIDHVNGDRSDNRILNLRELPQPENTKAFRTKSKGKTSKYRGVSLLKRKGYVKWRATIHSKSEGKEKSIHIGMFSEEKDAAKAYDKAAALLGFKKEALNSYNYPEIKE